jgi:hypothetical protein
MKSKLELRPLILEICHLATVRNDINLRRHRARSRKSYYANAVRILEAHKESNSQLRYLRNKLENTVMNSAGDVHTVANLNSKIDAILASMEYLRTENPRPKKWLDMGLHKLRSLVLQNEGEYALTKHETMEFSIKNRSRVKHLLKQLNCRLVYDNGSIIYITSKNEDGLSDNSIHITGSAIKKHATEHELNLAMENVLK